MRQFYGRLENALFLQEKPMSIKFLVLGGGGILGLGGGGGSADSIFMAARIFLNASVFSTHTPTRKPFPHSTVYD